MKRGFTRLWRWIATILAGVMVLGLSSGLPVSAAYENTHVNTGNQIEDIIAVAETQLGYTEGSSNYTKYGVWYRDNIDSSYNYANAAWCSTFVSWCANQAGISSDIIKYAASCDVGKNQFMKQGRWQNSAYQGGSYTPKRGDIIYYSNGATLNDSTHVGIVTGCSDGYVYTIEGNYSDKVKTRTIGLSNNYIIGYGVPNYSSNVISPTWASLNIINNQTVFQIGETVSFEMNSDYATNYTIGIDYNGSRIITENCSGNTYSNYFTQPGIYSAYVTAYNVSGWVDSNSVSFTIPEAPTWSNLSIVGNQSVFAMGDMITFEANSENIIGHTIGINKNGERIITEVIDENSYSVCFNEVGDYTAYVTSWNLTGYFDSNIVTFRVVDKPTTSKLTLESGKTRFESGETISFLAESDNATGYTIGINKNDNRIITEDFRGEKYSTVLTEPGIYTAYVTAWNSLGIYDSDVISFEIMDVPTVSEIYTSKQSYVIGETIDFFVSSDNGTGYTIGIDKDGERIITEDFRASVYSTVLTDPGIYSAYVTAWNSLGILDSERVEFIVTVNGDIDLNYTSDSSDANLLQSYLLGETTLTESQYALADLNADGAVNGLDLALMRQKLAS